MMKKLLILFVMAGMILTSCNKNKWIETDYSNDIVGTWTCLEAGYAEALVINADGTIASTGVDGERYWEDVKGTYEMVNNKMIMKFDDNDNFEGRFEMIPGETMVLIEEDGERNTYRYCTEDLSEEIVGLWVCTDGPTDVDNDMMTRTFTEDGKSYFTGLLPIGDTPEFVLDYEVDYYIAGDLVYLKLPENNETKYSAERLMYTPNATELGDIMTISRYLPTGEGLVETKASFLRVKQYLNLAGKKYDYNNVYVSNVKGLDVDIEFMGYTINFANMDGSEIDKLLKAVLFNIEFPDAETINYTYQYNNNKETFSAPIVVEGNKMIVKMSEKIPTLRDVEFLALQDASDSQMHIYMYKKAFVDFHTNMQAMLMASQDEQFDITDAEAIDAIYNSIDSVVETINMSLIFK